MTAQSTSGASETGGMHIDLEAVEVALANKRDDFYWDYLDCDELQVPGLIAEIKALRQLGRP